MEVDLLKYDFGMCYFNSGFMNIAGKKCFWNHMYQKIVQMINLSPNILWTSYKILFTIKSGGLCYQNYLKYIISNYAKGFGMCCYFNSGWKKLILKIEIPLKYCNKNAWWSTCLQNIFWTIYKGLFTIEEKMSHQRIFLSECGTLNIIHHFQKNHT